MAEAPLTASGLSHVGRERERNEDAYLVDVGRGLFAVADGMGGHRCGAQASRLAIEALDGYVTAARARAAAGRAAAMEDLLFLALAEANEAVLGAARWRPECWDMGTTLVVALLDGATAHVLGVGDSLAYRVTAVGLERLNRPHRGPVRTADAWWMRGEGAGRVPRGAPLTQYVGSRTPPAPSYRCVQLAAEDQLLLCSDGLTDELGEAEVLELASGPGSVDARVRRLVDRANAAGGRDNVTVVLVAR
jgi:protein phosphatase